MTIPTMLGVTAAAFLGLPLLVPVAIVADAVRGRFSFPLLRLYLFLLQYAFNDSVEIVVAPLLWLLAGFGRTLSSPKSVARHERLQWWSVELLELRAEQLLGLKVEVSDHTLATLGPTSANDSDPIIVLSRHVSLFDASLPALLAHKAGRSVRAIIMAELLADPGFDLLYGRLGSVFIPRDDGPQARQAIAAMTSRTTDLLTDQEQGRGGGRHDQSVGRGTAVVLFPEGRLFTKSGRDRSMKRLGERDPQRADRLASMTNLLPPKSGGLDILLDAMPTADVVVLNHVGLDSLPKMTKLANKIPVADPIQVSATRISRSTIPEGSENRKLWLDELWLGLEAEIAGPRG